MAERSSHDDYVHTARERVVDIATRMVSGDMPFLEGAIEISRLRFEAGGDSSDPDFAVFVAIESDIDHLPIGGVRELWDPVAAAKLDPEIEEATETAKLYGLPACASLIARYSSA